MIITVCGTPGSNHLAISNKLASRYKVPLVSASSVHNRLVSDNFQGDMNLEVNCGIATELSQCESCVCDSLVGPFLIPTSIKVLLVREMTSITKSAETLYNDRQAEYDLIFKEFEKDCFSYDNYDVIVNVTGMDEDVIVETIVSSIESGKKCLWIPPKLVLPESLVDFKPVFFEDPEVDFTISKCYATYIISDNYAQCIFKANHNKLLLVHDANIRNIPAYELNSETAYRNWVEKVNADRNLFQMNLMLSKYCYAEMLHDVDKAYVQLIKGGNPAKKLYGMGYNI